MLHLSRRGLIATAATVPAALAAPNKACFHDLTFTPTVDADALVVSESVVGTSGAPVVSWLLPIRAFGPSAWFDMAKPAAGGVEATEYRLIVRDAAYGDYPKIDATLIFRRPALRWTIAFASSLWGDDAPVSDSVGFEMFMNKACPSLWVSSARARRALDRVFQSRFDIASPNDEPFSVAFDSDLLWTVEAKNAPLMAFRGAISLPDLLFGWGQEASPVGKHPKTFFFGRTANASIVPTASTPQGSLALGDPAGHHVAIAADTTNGLTLDARIGPSPLDPRAAQVVLHLQLGAGEVGIKVAAKTLAGPIRAQRLAATDTRLPGEPSRASVRTVVWGDAFAGEHPGPSTLVGEIASPIGTIEVGAPDVESLPPESTARTQAGPTAPRPNTPYQPSSPADELEAAVNRLLQTAAGDKGGMLVASLFVVGEQRPPGVSGPTGLRRIAIDLSLHRAAVAPADTSFSALTFDRADLRLNFADGDALFQDAGHEYPRRLPSSWIWAGPLPHGRLRAELDLSRATLSCARDYDLMSVRLRFDDLVLAFAGETHVRPAREDCRVLVRDGVVVDGRPTLVCELDPQHVMEEAVFLPEPPPLPDGADLPSYQRDTVINRLKALQGDLDKTAAYRKEVQDAKAADPRFDRFVAQFQRTPGWNQLGKVQQLFIGPFALDPDAMAVARAAEAALGKTEVADWLAHALDKLALFVGSKPPNLLPVTGTDTEAMRNALRNEAILEQQQPVYGVYREFWRDQLARAINGAVSADQDPLSKVSLGSRGLLGEYLLAGNRPDKYVNLPFDQVYANLIGPFVELAMGRDAVDGLMGARLSQPSRLAFRVNCQPLGGLDAEAAGVTGAAPNSPARPGGGGVTYAPIPFTFEALSDWSHHELAVTRRARKLFDPLGSGLLPPIGNRPANASDLDMLAFQGFTRGEVTSAQRMAEIRTSLSRTPTMLETTIELPARLQLSPSQDAVWLTNRRIELARAPAANRVAAEDGDAVLQQSQMPAPPRRLWSVRLAVDGMRPNVRAVGSPDLRPAALGNLVFDEHRLPSSGAPPRGPLAPWFIGPEQMDGQTLPSSAGASEPTGGGLRAWLNRRAAARTQVSTAQLALFRTTLDASDRHQIVLQSSGYGLPVLAATQPDPNNPVDTGAAGQITPGLDWSLIDATGDQAIYRPLPLEVRELSLSALGGSLLHDTHFIPAIGAYDDSGRRLFDGFSIERYQHDIILGRDVRVEVVYKGYLLPFCHRASLVKLTERVFLRTKTEGIKALLRQRMFLRVGKPVLGFPLMGQPHGGRLWCGKTSRVDTERTPDLLDPTAPADPTLTSRENINGRVYLDNRPGLAFWPRTDITPNGLVRFDVEVDGARTKIPMMFIDTIATTDEDALKAACAHYNAELPNLDPSFRDDLNQRRTAPFGGEPLRYAVEQSPGDTSLATDWVRIRVHGGLNPYSGSWTGRLDSFKPNPVLLGADQPSFYPAVEQASIRLTQVERLTGGRAASVTVQYDGHYIRYGFDQNDLAAAQRNESEVFLNLFSVVPLDMGSNGNRSGAIGRPNAELVAIGRKKGPLGADGRVSWTRPDGTEAGHDDIGRPQDAKNKPLALPLGLADGLVSLSALYNTAAAEPARPQVTQQGAPPVSNVVAPVDGALRKLHVLQQYFSGDAKLLGVITIKQLLALLDFNVAEMPALKQVVEYGGAIENAASDLVDDLRTRVLQPLRAALGRLEAAWDTLADKLAISSKLPKDAMRASLDAALPEIRGGLADLEPALDAAIATEDPLSLPGKLADVYASARRLIQNLATLSAHPVERLEQGLTAGFEQEAQGLIDQLDQYATLAGKLSSLATLLREPHVAAGLVRSWLDGVLPHDTGALAAVLPLATPYPDLPATLAGAGIPMPLGAFANAIAKAQTELQAAVGDGRALLLDAVSDAVSATLAGQDPGAALARRVNDYLGDIQVRAGRTLAVLQSDLQDVAEAEVAAARQAALASMDNYVAELEQAVADRVDFMAVTAAFDRIQRLVSAFNALMACVRANPTSPEVLIAKLSDVAEQALGIDLGGRLEALQDQLAQPVIVRANAVLGQFRLQGPFAPELTRLRGELARCDADKPPPPPDQASSAVLAAVATAVAALDQAAAASASVRQAIAAAPAMGANAGALNRQLDLLTRTEASLRQALGALYCDLARASALLVTLGEPALPFDAAAMRQFTGLIARLRALAESLAGHLQAIASIPASFHDSGMAAGGVLAAAGALSVLADIDPDGSIGRSAAAADASLAVALTGIVNPALGVLRTSLLASSGTIATLRDAVSAMDAVASKTTLPLDLNELSAALKQLGDHIALYAALPDIAPPPGTVKALLATPLGLPGSPSVAEFFGGSTGPSTYADAAADLRRIESKALAQLQAVQRIIAGLPDVVRLALEGLARSSGLVDALAAASAVFLDKRNEVLNDAVTQGLLAQLARDVLVVVPDPNLGAGSCAAGDPSCDRLAQETKLLAGASKTGSAADLDRMRPALLAYVAGWSSGQAAPLAILHGVGARISLLLRGKVLAAFDFGSFRDLIEDAISSLIPTRVVLSYDFASRIANEPDENAIFQPKMGAEFGIAVRGTVDLLHADAGSFSAKAHLGPFEVKLIGGIVDALTLRFGGAAFVAEDGAKPRFDVSYQDFEIGPDLKFAQQLQSYLSPKDGSGLYLQPLTEGIGIEAGYAIDLGVLSLGETSFFNVKLNVSAELPFDGAEARFKVGLGRAMAPFTMSVFPFAGSGYFSVIATAKGVIGFEASFEFGGGGSIGFGPLTAVARIQVGVFVRLMKIANGMSTTIYGTFFAGGSASIWIFSFATSLYVRLGRADGGAMYGEAVYTFSFSLGLVDYDFSITAYKREAPVGQSTARRDDDGGVQFAWVQDSHVASDVASPYARALTGAGRTTPKPPPPGVGRKQLADQDDWDTYAAYFDPSLLECCKVPHHP